jgi:hypothetical protein
MRKEHGVDMGCLSSIKRKESMIERSDGLTTLYNYSIMYNPSVVNDGALPTYGTFNYNKFITDKSGGYKNYDSLDSVDTGVSKSGKVIGSLDGLTSAERKVINDLISKGKNVEIIPKTTTAKTPDFIINGVKTELKSLQNPNINTGITRIQKGFKQGADTVIIDGRNANLSVEQANEIINRAMGSYKNKILPGKVEIWTNDGIIGGGK